MSSIINKFAKYLRLYFCALLEIKETTSNKIDFSFHKRTWGHNFTLLKKMDAKGLIWELSFWFSGNVNVDDILLLGIQPSRTVGYKITELNPCGDPRDMYFAKCEFCPKSEGAV